MSNSAATSQNVFTQNFVLRVLFISMAATYVVTALKVLDAFWPKKSVSSLKL